MKFRIAFFALLIALLATLVVPEGAQAAKGLPGSPDFGYGINLDIQGKYLPEALQSASHLQVDWIGLDFNWGTHWPLRGLPPSLNDLDQVMSLASQLNLAVMISLENAPRWALSQSGPDPIDTSDLIVLLAHRYPDTLRAVEVFPGANTSRGWGASPDPGAYTRLLHTIHNSLDKNHIELTLIAGGLVIPGLSDPGFNLDDLAFLRGMYAAGAAQFLPVVSLRFPQVTGDPQDTPSFDERHALRHYEEARAVMVENHHENGMIWVTTFQYPSGRIQSQQESLSQEEAQSAWLVAAYQQLRAQIYIGAAFFSSMNPPAKGSADRLSLIQEDFTYHPFYSLFEKLIAANNRDSNAAYDFSQPQFKFIMKARP